MKTLIITLLATFIIQAGQDLVAKDSNGLVVEVKEKYGITIVDTCTVVMNYNGQFVLVRRDGTSAWYPTSFHSIKIVGKVEGLEAYVSNVKGLKKRGTFFE